MRDNSRLRRHVAIARRSARSTFRYAFFAV
jgi:hypothetical protein